MAAKKIISAAETSLLAVASFTACLGADRVVAREIFSPSSYPSNLQRLSGVKLKSTFFLAPPATVAFTEPLGDRPLPSAISEDLFAPLPDRSTTAIPLNLSVDRSIFAGQINIFYNDDLANIVNNLSLSAPLPQATVPSVITRSEPQKLSKIAKFQRLATAADIAQTAVPKTVPPSPEIEELVEQVRTSLSPTVSVPQYTPAISFVTPIGYGGYFGNVGLGVAYQSSTALGNKDDGNFGATVSLGDPSKFVGVDLTFTVNSISDNPNRGNGGNFGSNTLTLQLSRLISDDWSFGIGAENLVSFDARNISTTKSYYAVTTKVFQLDRDRRKPFSTLYTSIGLGNGRFLPAGKVTVQGESGVNVFGSVAIQAIEGVNGIVEWSGQDLNLAVSVVPFRNIPLAITPAVVDLIGTSQNRGARFNISVGYSFNF